MKVCDVMTSPVIAIGDQQSATEAANLLSHHHIHGLPVVDRRGRLLGMLNDVDLPGRASSPSQLFESESGKTKEIPDQAQIFVWQIMSTDTITLGPEDDLSGAVRLMEERQLLRIPVTSERHLVGMVTRTNLVQAFATVAADFKMKPSDSHIRSAVLLQLAKLPWARERFVNVTVKDGVVDLWGTYTVPGQDKTATEIVGTIGGIASVRNHLTLVDEKTGQRLHSQIECVEPSPSVEA